METGKSVARLRLVRDLLGRTGSEDEGEEREAGFTLIELMVVLLIMGILLAIAIPTFLSVTGSANKTAAQSNLTDSITSATAIYTNTHGFTTTGATPVTMTTKLAKTQNTITYLTDVAIPAATKGKNVISVDVVNNTVVVMVAQDGKTVCWAAALNETGTAVTGIPVGNQFYGKKVAATACTPAAMITDGGGTPGWAPAFSTFKLT